MFRPRDSADQRLIHAGLRVTPEPTGVRWIHDVFGNCVTLVDFDGAGPRAAVREPDPARAHAAGRPGVPDRRRRAHLSVRLPRGGGRRPRADHREAVPRRHGPPLGAAVRAATAPDRDRAPADDALLRDPRELRLLAPDRARHPATGGDAGAPARHLPRLRAADDRRGALARLRRPLRLGLRLRPRPRRPGRAAAAARPTPGRRSTCPAPAGSSSTRPTASSATAT